ncbi:integrase catalytic domain-containing protein [Pedobacter cryoconitis]|uniref:Integrase catalytic domain-containing protein n=1 Tax=Pedobacter cryoconitis TaxID=188932 RepID=A0A7X0J2B4_9SPHI|nr:hypothetical protein [Pedobacter cryoconitis]MBB6499132.1 hypothetical protein [Pedobacter cryoconitis]
MYQYKNNILSIPARLLYQDWSLMSYDTYKKKCDRKQLIRTQQGKGLGNEAFLSYADLPHEIKSVCLDKIGRPEETVVINLLEPFIIPDSKASAFFSNHRTPEGRPLAEPKQRQKSINCWILNAVQLVFEDRGMTGKMFGKRKTRIWQNISEAVNKLDTNKWNHTLPGAAKRLKEKYENYLKEGYGIFIHKGEGNQNTAKIRGEVADFILSHYALPIKLTIPMVLAKYNLRRLEQNWPELAESGLYHWLYEPEQERIWTLARHGKQAWQNKFQHTLSRDKSNWFPNVYWAIDGTKLDWIHFDHTTGHKMASKLRINVLFDVYSEKIIGWSLSETEDHTDHFKAIKMAVKQAECRPYLLTYDNQSGHKMTRMQEFYNDLVALKGGCHHAHRAGAKNNPAEQLFNRFQQQVITKFWFSDGQGIRVKKEDHQPNTDFITAHKHHLKSKEELSPAWEMAVNQWNSGKHPHFEESRDEMYQHPMSLREQLSLQEIMQHLWVTESQKPITYKKEGLTLWLSHTQYQYEVYDGDGNIDIEFRRKYVGKKFIVRYDPDAMDVYIQLCELNAHQEKVFVAFAEPKRKHIDIPVLMQADDKMSWARDYAVRDIEYKRDKTAFEALIARSGYSPSAFIESQELNIKFKGSMPKKQQQKVDAEEDEVLLRM